MKIKFIFFLLFILCKNIVFAENITEIDSIRYVGNPEREIPHFSGKVSADSLENILRQLIERYNNKGFFNAFLEVRRFDELENNKILANIFINKKERFKVKDILVTDNLLKSNYLKSVFKFEEDYFDRKKMNNGIKQLEKLQFIKSISFEKIEIDRENHLLNIFLEAEKDNKVFLFGGLAAGSNNDLNGNLQIDLLNLFASAHKLYFIWRSSYQKQRYVNFTYYIPYFSGYDFDVRFSFENSYLLDSYSDFSGSLIFSYSFDNDFSLGNGFKYNRFTDLILKESKTYIFNESVAEFRSNSINFDASFAVSKEGKYEISLKENHLLYFMQNLFFQQKIKLENNNTDLMLFYGGADSFRGVLENFYETEYYYILGNELGFGKKNKFFIFNDNAYDDKDKIRYSFGVGAEIESGRKSAVNLSVGFYEKFDIKEGILHILWKGSF